MSDEHVDDGGVPSSTPRPAETPTPFGVLVIDKPKGWTSMDVCARVRARLRRGGAPKRIKVGHAGTLDPMATGVLVVLIGKATRLCERAMAETKRYEAEVDLCHTSDTDDAEGNLLQVSVFREPSRSEVEAALTKFVGEIMQKPPAVSALHVGGRRAYELARAGTPADLPARPVRVYKAELLSYEFPLLRIDVTCGKGTYIRSIARDLGGMLGCGGMLSALRRTASGGFQVQNARALDSLPDPLVQADLMQIPGEWLSPEAQSPGAAFPANQPPM